MLTMAHSGDGEPKTSGLVLTIGEYRIDRRKRALFRGDALVRLTPKSFRLLEYLAQNCERAVSKAEILENVWGPGNSEGTLRQELFMLRRALRAAGAHALVVTIPKYGYRFAGPHAQTSGPLHKTQHFGDDVQLSLMKGTQAFAETGFANSLKALHHFSIAARLADDSLAAHGGAAKVWLTLGQQSLVPPQTAMQQLTHHVERARWLIPNDPELTVVDALAKALFDKNIRTAHETVDRLKADFQTMYAVQYGSAILNFVRLNLREAIEDALTAVNLAPAASRSYLLLAMLYVHDTRYDLARQSLRMLHEVSPLTVDCTLALADTEMLLGEHQSQIEILASIPGDVRAISSLCVAYARAGFSGHARETLVGLLAMRSTRFISGYYVAKCLAALGEWAQAVEALAQASHEPLLVTAGSDPWFEPLRGDLSFKRLTRAARFALKT